MTKETQNRTVVIVGASAAGSAAAESLRKRGYRGTIQMIGDETQLAYDRPPLSKQLLLGEEGFEFVQLLTEADVERLDINLLRGVRAVGLDRKRQVVALENGSETDYDHLIVATGVRARQLAATDRVGDAFSLRTYDDALALRERLRSGCHVVVLGAGFIGLEVAATAVKRGCIVHVVEPAGRPLLGKFPSELADRIQQDHEARGVRFHFGTSVSRWNNTPEGALRSVTLEDGSDVAADVAVVGIGTIPNTEWLSGSDLVVDNGVVCDERGRAAERVFAVGDVANWFHPRIGANVRVEHRLSAGEQADIVAAQISETDIPDIDLPFFWSDQYEAKWQAYGHIRSDADLEVIVDDSAANRIVAVLTRDGVMEAVVGKNAAKQLIPYRRQLKCVPTN
ncbi:FAD-dependent oxidoreductase [Rhodococcus pseudokoreensis]|uniref:FAD-dependent oxidoreductase n=1 Tax=Rhodococcus pseudokoreensis TaxID=2811421 RepID=A0A974ZW98_9NOCA|nr:FAD-dependent oxidoreductase [Rhodococcus pseudokoreensis]QSE92784.1 FAD-dependent oxidoreductase [Rhodococcus pseudokoreensis]